ncbi:Sucrose-6F-phosphate phosphohydrolase [Gracilaria domingensis]|nr:Sucrose-6F-phosphate phosphohydrolase [Gracilaria domingensis]
MIAFITHSFPFRTISSPLPSSHASSWRPSTPRCAANKLLVVDLQQLLRNAPANVLAHFSERVTVERNATENGTYLLYSSRSGYAPSIKSIQDANLVEPDALAVLDGSELYQRHYRTPDPYWARTVRQHWQPKPIRWIVSTFFAEHIELVEGSDEFQLVFGCKDGVVRTDVCAQLATKLTEMGITTRVSVLGDDRHIAVAPAAAGASEVIAFCQTMLGVEEKNTFVFGSDELVGSCVRGKANVGMCGVESSDRWEGLGDRVYVSKEKGAKALLDGVLHHAVF